MTNTRNDAGAPSRDRDALTPIAGAGPVEPEPVVTLALETIRGCSDVPAELLRAIVLEDIREHWDQAVYSSLAYEISRAVAVARGQAVAARMADDA